MNVMRKFLAILFFVISSVVSLIAQGNQAASIERGKKVYGQYCVSCHMVDGNGVPNFHPPLAGASYVTGDKKRLIQVVLKGFAQKVPIDGEYYSDNMAAFNTLKDQEIADLLTYIRSDFGNKATAVTVAEVKAVRTTTK